jgi:hypothetical protein
MLRRFAAWAVVLLACHQPPQATADVVTPWIRLVTASSLREGLEAPVASRLQAYGATTLYEAYATDSRSGLRSLAGQLNGLWHVPTTSGGTIDAATIAAEATRIVLDSMFSGASALTKSLLDSLSRQQIAARRAAGVDGKTSDRSLEHGRHLARDILTWAAADGFFATRNRPWRPTVGGGTWTPPRATGPNIVLAGAPAMDKNTAGVTRSTPRALEPHWGRLRNFTLRYGDECEPPRAPDFATMSRELRDSAASITADKRSIAAFWADSTSAAAIVRWTNVADTMVVRRSGSAATAAETYALATIAMADGYIAAWKEKYRALVARPAAATAPESPEYPSESAVVSAATAAVLTHVLGDSTPFTHRGRVFRNFLHARDEAAIAAVYAGTQFVPSVVNGVAQGHCVAARVLGRLKTR